MFLIFITSMQFSDALKGLIHKFHFLIIHLSGSGCADRLLLCRRVEDPSVSRKKDDLFGILEWIARVNENSVSLRGPFRTACQKVQGCFVFFVTIGADCGSAFSDSELVLLWGSFSNHSESVPEEFALPVQVCRWWWRVALACAVVV